VTPAVHSSRKSRFPRSGRGFRARAVADMLGP
jgi:hypothetical protein